MGASGSINKICEEEITSDYASEIMIFLRGAHHSFYLISSLVVFGQEGTDGAGYLVLRPLQHGFSVCSGTWKCAAD